MKFRSRWLAVFVAAMLMPFAAVAADAEKAEAAKTEKTAAKEKAEPKKAEAVACGKITGSRIKSSKAMACEKASNRPVRIYTAEELRNTGEFDTAEALRTLDPAVQ
jgi:hypothetical protein